MSDFIHPFDRLVQPGATGLRVAEAALLFARDHAPDLAVRPWLEKLDELAQRVDRTSGRGAEDRVAALRAVLVDQERLIGNREDYFDPRNSFLHEVLTRRTGMPICLSTIWLDVCEQLGWPFAGVGLPGHYIIRCDAPAGEILIDPFHGGRVVERTECNRIVSEVIGRPIELTNDDFEGISKRLTLSRMLNNLRWIYTKRRDWHHAALVIARLLALQPDSEGLRHELRTVREKIAGLN